MTTDLATLACEDCPATIEHGRGAGMFGSVPMVRVGHEPSCPRCRHLPAGGMTIRSGPDGIIMHFRRDDVAEATPSVGDGE